MSKIFFVLLAWTFFSSPGNSQTGIYEFKLRGFPVNSAECPDIATDLARTFSQQTGLTIYSSRCERASIDDEGSDVSIFYQAEEKSLTTEVDDKFFAGYKDRDTCLQDLESQKNLFRTQTDLPLLNAYCTLKGNIRLYGLGYSAVKRHAFQSAVGEFPQSAQIYDSQWLERQITEGVQTAGITLSRVFISFTTVYVYYYSEAEVPFGFVRFPTLESVEACQAAGSEAGLLFEPRVQILKQFCAGTDGFGTNARTLYTFGIQKGHHGHFNLFGELDADLIGPSPDRYPTLQACLSDRQRVLNFYRTNLGRDVSGGLCSLVLRGQGSYQQLVFGQ